MGISGPMSFVGWGWVGTSPREWVCRGSRYVQGECGGYYGKWDTTGYGQYVDSKHPTGMISCLDIKLTTA